MNPFDGIDFSRKSTPIDKIRAKILAARTHIKIGHEMIFWKDRAEARKRYERAKEYLDNVQRELEEMKDGQ
jgi:hypothetical protein